MKPRAENAKSIIWGISPWGSFWVMGERKGMPSYYYGVKAFVDAGCEFHLFAPNDGASKTEETYEGIYIHRFKVPMERPIRAVQARLRRIKYLGPIGTNLLQFLYVSLYTLAAVRRVRRQRKKARPSIIYAYTSYSAPAAWILGGCYHIPNITRLFGVMDLYKALSSPLWRLSQWQGVLEFKLPCKYLIVTNDGTQGDKAAQKLGVPAERLKFWRNGVNKHMCNPDFDSDKFKRELGFKSRNRIILTVGRLVGNKRKERLIKAVPSIVSQHKEVVFLIVGDGPEREKLEKLSQNLGVSKYVRFMGAVTLERVADYMNAADIFVSVNDFTNANNPSMEAMVCGKCVVALDTGGTAELIQNNLTGKLIRAGGEEEIAFALAKAIVDVLEDDELRTRLGENARIYAQEHFQTWEERVAMEIRLIEGLLEENEEKKRRKVNYGSG